MKKKKKYLQKILTPDAKVLEVGCGDGRSIFDILPVTKNVTGIDHDDKAISDAKNNFPVIQQSKFSKQMQQSYLLKMKSIRMQCKCELESLHQR